MEVEMLKEKLHQREKGEKDSIPNEFSTEELDSNAQEPKPLLRVTEQSTVFEAQGLQFRNTPTVLTSAVAQMMFCFGSMTFRFQDGLLCPQALLALSLHPAPVVLSW
ncbi:hypothetical protein Ccrd_020816 [Cynara cardunculus var. scolymus]|uniref:Uncharacterized protein n=1 Tax=Cynara cardunculus var. scolymus TaxID=59895 RepID=A0A103Y1R8_CYNCS|nr:hypothetical protein Ccrd_020816 [Cynara cardunculus var. scolymus]